MHNIRISEIIILIYFIFITLNLHILQFNKIYSIFTNKLLFRLPVVTKNCHLEDL